MGQRWGANALLYPNTPASVAKPGLPRPLLWHAGPVGLGRAVRGGGKRCQSVLRQALRPQPKDQKSQFKAQDCPPQALAQDSRPGLGSHDRRVQGLLSGIRGWYSPHSSPPLLFWSKTKVQMSLQLELSSSCSAFPWECQAQPASHGHVSHPAEGLAPPRTIPPPQT